MVFMSSRRKHGRKALSKYKKNIFITVNSHINTSEPSNLNTSNINNVIGN